MEVLGFLVQVSTRPVLRVCVICTRNGAHFDKWKPLQARPAFSFEMIRSDGGDTAIIPLFVVDNASIPTR